MSLYREIKEFVRSQIKFDDNFPQDSREYTIMHFADCIEEYIAEYIEHIPSDQKLKEYLFDLALNHCFESYAKSDDDDEFYDDDELYEDEFYEEEDLE